MEPPRTVLDTNVIISGIINRLGLPRRLLTAWRSGELTLVTSSEIIAEVERVLHKPRIQRRHALTEELIRSVVEELRSGADLVAPLAALPIQSRDPNDDMFLAVALGSAVEYVVTGDDDLLSLKGAAELGELQIVTPREFLDLLTGSDDAVPEAPSE